MRLRDYQEEALASVREAYGRGVHRVLVCLATGLGKCVDPDTLVWSKGLHRFEDIVGADRIATHAGVRKVTGWWDDGINPGYRVTTTHGFEIDGTLDHRVWIRRDDGFEGWCRMEDLQIGDYLAVARGKADFGDEAISEDDAYLLGLVLADGCLVAVNKKKNGKPVSRHGHRLQIDGHPIILERIMPTLEHWRQSAGGRDHGAVRLVVKSPQHHVLLIQAPRIKDYLQEEFGMDLGYSQNRVVPSRILRSRPESIKAFLRGYYDGDGFANPIPGYATSSKKLSKQIQHLLLGLGVFAGIRTRSAESTGGLPSHLVNIYDVEAFYREVGYNHNGLVKDIYLDNLLAKERNPNWDTIPGLGEQLRQFAQSVESKHRNPSIRHIRNYYDSKKKPGYKTLRSWAEENVEAAESSGLSRILSDNYIWQRIEEKVASSIRRIDCEVDDVHAFIGNGLVNHNTVLLSALPLKVKPRPHDAMLILVNRDELVGQTVDKLKKVHPGGKIGIEKAQLRAAPDDEFIVASVQTLHKKRLDEFFKRFGDRIGIMIIDECHHAAAASYIRIVDKLFSIRPDALLMGVTATPQRADGVGLGIVFDEVAFHRDMKWAIDQGYLVPVRCFKVKTNVNIDNVTSRAGDFAIEELGEAVDVAGRNDIIVSAYLQHTPGKKAIAFCANLKHAEHLAAAFNARGVPAAWASGSDSKLDRNGAVERFRRGEILVLVNCGLWIEGFDVPDTEVMIGARPTQSPGMYVQMVGRVLRPLDEVAPHLGLDTTAAQRRTAIATSKKPIATVLDIVDQAKRHSLITLPTLWGLPPALDAGGEEIENVAKRYEKLAEKNPLAAKTVVEVKDIETAIEETDAWAVPQQPPEIIEISSMAWRMAGENRYRLQLPMFYEGKMPDGSAIKQFARKYRARLAEAKRKGAFPFEGYAQEHIGFDPTTFKEFREVIEIRPGVLEAFDVLLERNSNPRVLGSVATLHEAFTRAEAWIEHNRGDLSSALSAKAAWRDKEPTPNQIKTLKDKFGVPMHLIPEKRGDCTVLITKLIDERKFKKREIAS